MCININIITYPMSQFLAIAVDYISENFQLTFYLTG